MADTIPTSKPPSSGHDGVRGLTTKTHLHKTRHSSMSNARKQIHIALGEYFFPIPGRIETSRLNTIMMLGERKICGLKVAKHYVICALPGVGLVS